jgi:hypothetical protein
LCWQLTVVLLAAFPVIAAAGAFMIKVDRIRYTDFVFMFFLTVHFR